MAKYKVLRDKGWPVNDPKYAFGRTFESDSKEDAKGCKQGYLQEIDEPGSAPPAAEFESAEESGSPIDEPSDDERFRSDH